MNVEDCPEFKGFKTTAERVAFTHGWYAALDAESQKPTTNTRMPRASKEDICPFCAGTGEVDFADTGDCGHCGGTGKRRHA